MKILNKAKLVALIPLITLAFGCESKVVEPITDEKSEVEQKVKQPSLLRQQIQLMLAGKKHNEAILKTEVGKQEWKDTFATLKEELAKYTAQNGEKPEKKYTAQTYAKLSRVRAEFKKEKSLESLENTIKQAIEDEKRVKTSH